MRRGIALGVALAALSFASAHASSTTMSTSTTTSLAGVVLPISTVGADEYSFSIDKRTGERTTAVHLSGSNLPATESVVTTVWRGTVRADRDGAAVGASVATTHRPFPGGSVAEVLVERQVRGGWVACPPDSITVLRPIKVGVSADGESFGAVCRGVRRGAAVPVRVTFVVTYDETIASIDDTLSVTAKAA